MRMLARAEGSYSCSDAFALKTQEDFTNQFANLYFSRLAQLGPLCEKAARRRWDDGLPLVKSLDAEPGETCLVIGTLYKEMEGKPNVLKEQMRDALERREREANDNAVDKYCGAKDSLSLEDESGRVMIAGEALEHGVLVTGAIIAVRGTLDDDGVLQVEGVCLPGLPPQPPLTEQPAEGDRYVAFVSGLNLGDSQQDMTHVMLLTEYLTGQLGGDRDHKTQASIVRLIIAGNVMYDVSAAAKGSGSNNDVLRKKAAEDQRELADRLHALDVFLTTVAAAMPIDVMPGAKDPCNFLMPQQPFHKCMLPQATRLSTLSLCTNPHACDIAGVSFLGTSGQPLDDMQKYLPGEDRLETLAQTLRFQHVAPTAPDTLGCYPFVAADPFIMNECPRVYFAGNQPKYDSVEVKGDDGQTARVIMVPDFAREHTCVLVNLRTLESSPITFSGFD